jgi:hypothetical protein
MTASFTEQMLTIYTHLGMLSRGKNSLRKSKVQLCAVKLDSGFRRNDDEGAVMRGLDPRICEAA